MISRAGSCLAARLSRRVGGVPLALVVSFLVVGEIPAVQPDGRACRRVTAAVISVTHGGCDCLERIDDRPGPTDPLDANEDSAVARYGS